MPYFSYIKVMSAFWMLSAGMFLAVSLLIAELLASCGARVPSRQSSKREGEATKITDDEEQYECTCMICPIHHANDFLPYS